MLLEGSCVRVTDYLRCEEKVDEQTGEFILIPNGYQCISNSLLFTHFAAVVKNIGFG